MLKNLLPLVLILFIATGVGYFIFVSPHTQKAPTGSSLTQTLTEVPKDNSIESRVSFLESTVNTLKDQISKLSSNTPVNTKLSDTSSLEDKINKLDSRVTNLESAPKIQTSTTPSTQYIPMGNGTSSTATDWTTVSLPEVSINSADYPGYTNAYLEVQLAVKDGNGTAYARLFNNTDGTAILASQVSSTSYNYTTVRSGAFRLDSGTKTYRLQLKTSTGYDSQVQFASIKITY